MDNCIFCDILAKKIPSEVLYETEHCIVIRDIHPQASTHYLVISKKHYPEFLDTPPETLSDAFILTKQIIQKENIQPYRLTNNGQGAAYVNHFHLHILGKVAQNRSL